ncbi:MAG: chorismate mutase [Actinomycetia bacterium]|nr:chorismate mutase [Actinomycetes bacterium]MCH9702435.1 chorismate mutase [Actinomycetes bacterium]MCH9761916.1 chorismate mutase [Actinomycetes bacterium]
MRRLARLLVETALPCIVAVVGVAAVAPLPGARADDPSPLFALVDAATQRLQTAEPIAAAKWRSGASIEDATRVQQVLNSVAAAAATRGVDPDRVRGFFEDQIAATEAIEYMRFAEWKLDPSAAPVSPPDLAASRAAIDVINHTMIDQIALQWPLLNGLGCRAALDGALTEVIHARGLDPFYQQALSFATRSYC